MNVLMISGDQRLTNGHERLQLQKDQVERLDVFSYQGVTSAVRGFFEVMRAASRVQYDIITAQEPFFRGLLAWFVARFSRARLNIQVHTDLSREPFPRRALARFVLRRANSIRVVSERLAEQVRTFGVRAKVSVLPIYIDVSRFKGLVPIPHAQKTVLWIGRFEPEKDPLRALEVLRDVRAQGAAAKLVMLGSGSMERELRAAAEGLPVEFPGWRDPLAYLQTADVAFSTSLHESWGASIVEALAAGVPVVSRDVGVAREAGAIIVAEPNDMPKKIIDVLQRETRGILHLKLPEAVEWAKQWRETLI